MSGIFGFTFRRPSIVIGNIAPRVSLPFAIASSANSADLSAVVNEPIGTLYVVVSKQPAVPSVPQVEAGKQADGTTAPASDSQDVDASNAREFSVSGLMGGNDYFAHFLFIDGRGVASPVATSPVFETPAPPPLAITGTPPDAELTVPYSWAPDVQGGVPAYTFAITSGALPVWANLNASTGEISGIPA